MDYVHRYKAGEAAIIVFYYESAMASQHKWLEMVV